MTCESLNGLIGSHPRTPGDVLIIGGGVIGLACAHYLARAGRTVQLIEQDRIGAGASSGNCGLVVVSCLLPQPLDSDRPRDAGGYRGAGYRQAGAGDELQGGTPHRPCAVSCRAFLGMDVSGFIAGRGF